MNTDWQKAGTFSSRLSQAFGNKAKTMYSILDIDLDYFNLMPYAAKRLDKLLKWAACPVSKVVERHNHAFAYWKNGCLSRKISPSHILHVDEHHDMMDQRQQANIANFMFHAMCRWPKCRVYWLVQHPIDSPGMWLEEEMWDWLRQRFSHGPNLPNRWPKPDLVSVCTSPDFVVAEMKDQLLEVVSQFTPSNQRRKCRTSGWTWAGINSGSKIWSS